MSKGDEGPALNEPRTRDALRRYRRRCVRATLLGFAGLVVATVVFSTSPDADPDGAPGLVALVGISWGGLALGVGLWGLLRSLRMGYLLGREPWARRRARYRIAPLGRNGQPALLIKPDENGSEAVCSVSATVWGYRQLDEGSDIPLLVVGNPRRWSVVAPPDVRLLLVAKRPWLPLWGRKLRKYAMEA